MADGAAADTRPSRASTAAAPSTPLASLTSAIVPGVAIGPAKAVKVATATQCTTCAEFAALSASDLPKIDGIGAPWLAQLHTVLRARLADKTAGATAAAADALEAAATRRAAPAKRGRAANASWVSGASSSEESSSDGESSSEEESSQDEDLGQVVGTSEDDGDGDEES